MIVELCGRGACTVVTAEIVGAEPSAQAMLLRTARGWAEVVSVHDCGGRDVTADLDGLDMDQIEAALPTETPCR